MSVTNERPPYNADDLVWWLRNGNDEQPFIVVGDLNHEDGLILNIVNNRLFVFDINSVVLVSAPLDDEGEIIWEDWQVDFEIETEAENE